jgi:hypothetical protein
VLKKPHRMPLALGLEGSLGESGSQSRRCYRIRQGWGCAGGREQRDQQQEQDCSTYIVALFPLVSLPVAVAPPPPPPRLPASLLSPVQQAPSPAAVAWPFGLDDDGTSVLVSNGHRLRDLATAARRARPPCRPAPTAHCTDVPRTSLWDGVSPPPRAGFQCLSHFERAPDSDLRPAPRQIDRPAPGPGQPGSRGTGGHGAPREHRIPHHVRETGPRFTGPVALAISPAQMSWHDRHGPPATGGSARGLIGAALHFSNHAPAGKCRGWRS